MRKTVILEPFDRAGFSFLVVSKSETNLLVFEPPVIASKAELKGFVGLGHRQRAIARNGLFRAANDDHLVTMSARRGLTKYHKKEGRLLPPPVHQFCVKP